MAKVYRVNGNVEDVRPKNGKHFSLEEMYALIGCEWVEFVYLSNGIMVVDEEGKLNAKEYNDKATAIASVDQAICLGDWIAGDALVCDNNEVR